MIGTKLAHYEITSHLGTGGMGEVYQATDTKLGRSVAIKLLPEAFSRDSDRAARFEREARLLASLNHSHIAAIYGIEEINQRKFLVMELAMGETLADCIKRGPIPPDEVRLIAKQIAEALEAAHEKGIIHRDLKPANIKITPQGDVKVLDFGLAKAFAGDFTEMSLSNSPTLSMAATNAGVILGTAAYMSPEQAKGKQADRTSDIWAFGCVLFEMLAGRPAFEGETLGEVLGSIFKSEPDWNRLPSDTSAGIRRLLRRCLQKDRRLRLHDIADARLEIDEAFDDAPAAAVQPDRVSRWRERIAWIALLVLFAAAAWMLKPGSKSSSTSIARLTIALPPGDQLVIDADTSIALSSDGSMLAYVATRAGIRQVYVRTIDDRDAKPIAGTEGAAGIVFSPDAQWIGFFQQGKLKKIPVSGGASQILAADIAVARGLDWGADDNIYYAPETTSGIWKVPARSGTPELITKLDRSKGEISHRLPQLLPGGKALLFTIWTGPEQDARSVHLQNLASGERHVLVSGADTGRYVATGHLVAHRSGALLALPFDLSNFTVSSNPPTPLVEWIGGSEGGVYTFSESGVLAYALGSSSASDGRLARVDRAGKSEEFSVAKSAISGLTLSPDGHRAAVESGIRVISIYDFARATTTPFVLNTVGASQGPLWSTDGEHIVYRGTRSGFRNLYWKAVDGASEEERLTTSENVQTPGSFSPDGKWLAYRENDPKTSADIWVLNLEDRKPQVFLNTKAGEYGPAFSRDGHWIAYSSDESGRDEVYARPFPGPGVRVQISTEGGNNPVWSRSGRELFFLNGDKMMAADAAFQPTLIVGSPHMLFQGRFARSGTAKSSFDVDKDGRFLLVPDSRSEHSLTQINVVLNWFEELRKLAPVR